MRLQTVAGPLLVLSWFLIAWPTSASAADPHKAARQPAQQERWDGAYRDGRRAPWDIGRPSTDLRQAVEKDVLRPCRVVELGCGSGNDAIYLASRRFDVTAIDIAPSALKQAEKKARDAGVKVRWLQADVLNPPKLKPFDLIYDRGCYHGVRGQNAAGYVETLRRLSRPGTQVLILAGNANEPPPHYGPPRVREADIRADFGPWFEFQWLRETRFDTTDPNRKGALAWSILLRRKAKSPSPGNGKQQPQPPPTPPVPEGVRAFRDLEYIRGGHERNRLDLYLPEKAERPLPIIVWIHGGGWQAGSKERTPAIPLAAKGYAVASINYRLSQHATFPAQIHDCKAAIRWLRAQAQQYGIDAEQIGVWGESAGGHLAALVGTTAGVKDLEGPGGNTEQPSRVQAVVDWYGPANFLTIPARPNRAQFLGGDPQKLRAKSAQASPVTHVSLESPPFLILHGDQDNKVPISQSVELAEALKRAGVEVTLQIVEGAGHGGPQFTSPDNLKLVADFFDKHLRQKK
jgi:acetyl esterase/lipase